MIASARLLEQRSVGQLAFTMGKDGPEILREAGASKIRIPRGSNNAIVINTGGGLAGGDKFDLEFCCNEGAKLTLTSQAAERVYRTLGPAASLSTQMYVAQHASLYWLPQETILYNGASLNRNYHVTLEASARFLCVEPIIFGRTESKENMASVQLQDRWRIWRAGKLLHAEDVKLGSELPLSKATLNGFRAIATLIYVGDDAELKLEAVRKFVAASAWNGKLIARFVAQDGFALRKALIPTIAALAGVEALPKIWTS